MRVTIFTDGAARGNPGRAGWAAIVAIEDKVIEIGGKVARATNNQMELTAAINALGFLKKLEAISQKLEAVVHTDSGYVANGITKWVRGWEHNGWKTKAKEPVLNVDLWKKLSALTKGRKIEWKLVSGHAGVGANERCDEIATAFADGGHPRLYEGDTDSYPISFSTALTKTKAKSKSRSTGPAYSYVSLVGGKISVSKTWAECEKKVKGKSGAVFKKATSAQDEKIILASLKKTGKLPR